MEDSEGKSLEDSPDFRVRVRVMFRHEAAEGEKAEFNLRIERNFDPLRRSSTPGSIID